MSARKIERNSNAARKKGGKCFKNRAILHSQQFQRLRSVKSLLPTFEERNRLFLFRLHTRLIMMRLLDLFQVLCESSNTNEKNPV